MKKWKCAIHQTVGVIMDDVLTKRFIGNWGELAYWRVWLPENGQTREITKLKQVSKQSDVFVVPLIPGHDNTGVGKGHFCN